MRCSTRVTMAIVIMVVGFPFLASAGGTDDDAPARRLTIRGRPLVEALHTSATINVTPERTLTAQPLSAHRSDVAGPDAQQQTGSEPGWWGRRSTAAKVGILVGIGLGTYLAIMFSCPTDSLCFGG